MGGQHHAPAALPPGKTRNPLYRGLDRPQGRSGRVRKISPPPGFDSRTVQPVASRYTALSYPGYFTLIPVYIFIICRIVLPRMRNVSSKSRRENQNILCLVAFFFFENRAIYEIMWKNLVEPDRQHVVLCRVPIACYKTKATNTHS